jgi:hypothetical protein
VRPAQVAQDAESAPIGSEAFVGSALPIDQAAESAESAESAEASKALAVVQHTDAAAAVPLPTQAASAERTAVADRSGRPPEADEPALRQRNLVASAADRVARAAPSVNAARSALSAALLFTTNALKNPEDPKYRRIRLGNAGFQRRLGARVGGIELLVAIGWRRGQASPRAGAAEEAYLLLKRYDAASLWIGQHVLRDAIKSLPEMPPAAPRPCSGKLEGKRTESGAREPGV